MSNTIDEQDRMFPDFHPTPGRTAYYDTERKSWQVFRYAEVQRVLSDYKTFTSNREGHLDPRETKPGTKTMIDLDPPEHRQMRTLLAQAFTPRAVERLEPRIIYHVEQLLDRVIDQGKMDIVDDFAAPLPLIIIMELLGVPAEDQQKARHLSDTFIQILGPESAKARGELITYFVQLIQQRRQQPQEDLISALLAAKVDDKQLSLEEIVNFCFLLLIAGNETTRGLISNAILCFDRHREAFQEVRANKSLLPGALEEVLRYLPPVVQFPRIAAVDTTIDGQAIQAGEWVTPWIMSANRDADYFTNPDIFDIRRNPNRHLGFGAGVHHCMGAPLARLEARIALQFLFERIDTFEIIPDTQFERVKRPLAYGLVHLPITFTRV